MSFVVTMAWRDTRASRRRLLFYSLSIALGIAALVAIGSFGANLQQAVNEQANGLLGADLTLLMRAPPEPALETYLAGLKAERAKEWDSSILFDFPGGGGESRPVQLRALEGKFPFYGTFLTEPASAAARLREGGAVAIVDEALLTRSGAKVGDSIKLGPKTFQVIGALREFPGEPQVLTALAPPVLVPLSEAPPPKNGARLEFRTSKLHLKLPKGADAAAIVPVLHLGKWASILNITSAEERKRNYAEGLTAIDRFFCLVGFVALFLGSIGLASTIHAYVTQKLNTVAVLRCLGASARQAFLVYLTQGAALGVVGSVAGAILGVAVQLTLPALFQDFLPFPVSVSVVGAPILSGMVAGFSICLLFTLLPLLAVRRVPPLAALRSAVSRLPRAASDPWRVILGVAIGAAVLIFARWETHSWPFAIGYAVMLVFSLGVFTGMAFLVSLVARRWPSATLPYVARQGIANLYRPNNRTTLLLVSLGLGTFLVLTLYLTRSSLLREFSNDARPNLVFNEVPEEQAAGLAALVKAEGGAVLDQIPIIRIKAVTINGAPAAKAVGARAFRRPGPPGGRPDDFLNLVATYRGSLQDEQSVAEGRFTGQVEPGAAIIPISTNLGPNWHLKLGDEVVWDVSGISLHTRIGSIRKSEGTRLDLGREFPVIFPLGALDGAPKTFALTARAPTPAVAKKIQRAATAAYPGVMALDIGVFIAAFEKIFRKVAFIVEFMALFTVATGVIMLAAAVVTGRYQRVRETVLLRTLGASRRQLQQIQLVEYSILGVLAALVGILLALGANGLLAHFVFKLPLHFDGAEIGIALVAVPLITIVTGAVADRGTTRRPPLEVLRQET
jgi:putative ABC transport system permease protein